MLKEVTELYKKKGYKVYVINAGVLLLPLVFMVVPHELGHYLAAALLGLSPGFVLTPILGITIPTSTAPLALLLVVLSGVTAGALFFLAYQQILRLSKIWWWVWGPCYGIGCLGDLALIIHALCGLLGV